MTAAATETPTTIGVRIPADPRLTDDARVLAIAAESIDAAAAVVDLVIEDLRSRFDQRLAAIDQRLEAIDELVEIHGSLLEIAAESRMASARAAGIGLA
jgi:hypothetical protein